MTSKYNKDVLIALIPNPADLLIAMNQGWYRIPASKKIVPKSVKNKTLKIIAFYQPRSFKELAFAVRFYAPVDDIKIVKRHLLFPDEPENEKSDSDYYKIEFKKLLPLPRPIISRVHRRILFINTTLEQFETAEEINDLFNESPLEEHFWSALKINDIHAERQYAEQVKSKLYYLDFAVLCKRSKIGIECDGDTYHMRPESVQYDKRRNNDLESLGWNVLRYTTEDIYGNLDKSISQVKETINRYGGQKDPADSNKVIGFSFDDQESLFD
ncbi:DUF559 domain-containing protein [bacterium]|nr:DUF559 domain-containing protein [bacterium]